ncbi:MAG TPA: F0F1 ATP synthase subunit A [Polyangiales bacterium]|nr:F0F1 ATP synthase subunit A [Polyangiales bacterium]
MPHGESWFSFLPYYEAFQRWISQTFGASYMEHSSKLGVQHVVAYAAVVLFLVFVGFYVNRRLKTPEDNILPEGKVTFFGFIETIVRATYSMSADLMGPKPAKYFLPLIGACALVIFFSNAMGLIPGFLPPTDNLNTTFAMAMVIFVATHVYGVKEHGFAKYFSHFFGPKVPWWIAWFINPLMFVIELISHIVRPITLAIRLMANMTADHLVLGIFVGLFAGLGLVLVPVPVVFYLMGCLVITVQTLVFCLLSVIYITLAIQHEEEH